MHNDFGCNLRQYLFEPKTFPLKQAIRDRIVSQLAKWLPFIRLAGISIKFSEDDRSIPDPGIRIEMDMTYGDIPINLILTFPNK